jgi:hypothetical protein
MAKPRYQVRGTDENGDTWTFGTDDRERAEAMLADMREDFEDTELIEG